MLVEMAKFLMMDYLLVTAVLLKMLVEVVVIDMAYSSSTVMLIFINLKHL
jgi:hypothetical protein